MFYCKKCWFPSTKPGFEVNDRGFCRACQSADKRRDHGAGYWELLEKQFDSLIKGAVLRQTENFDVLVPVSGGKDSITQVVRSNRHKARILAVTVDYGVKTSVGRRNLERIPEIGDNVHLEVYRPPQSLHRHLIRESLRRYGDPDALSHTLLHAYPLHKALMLRIPLVVLGENSASEYGGGEKLAALRGMTREWFESFAVSGGRTVSKIADDLGVERSDLRFYDFPDAIEKSETRSIFMSNFFRWDSEVHLSTAREYGFESLDDPREGTFRNYVGIDEQINRVHQYLKVLKFGYGRATDHVCEEIRAGRITRETGRDLVEMYDLVPLSPAVISEVSNYLDMTVGEFVNLVESHRNSEIWQKRTNGDYYIDGYLEKSP